MQEYKGEIHTKELLQFFSKHPGIMASFAYALLTLCGIFYSHNFYAKFDVPILKLADLPDMLIAGISEPIAVVMFCGGIALAVVTDLMFIATYRGSQRWKKKPNSLKKRFFVALYYTPKRKIEIAGFIIVIFILYAYSFVELYAEWKSEKIIKGEGQSVQLTSEQYDDKTLFLLGSTTNFVITYDAEAKRALLTPIEGVTQILPNPKPSKEEDDEEKAEN